MVREKYLVADDYRKTSIGILIDNLAALRARFNATQEGLANVIGVSRQTFYSIETGKRKMPRPICFAIIFLYTSEMMKELKIYPIVLITRFKDELEST